MLLTAVGSGAHSSQGADHPPSYQGQPISVQYGDSSARPGSTPDNVVYNATPAHSNNTV